MSKPKFDKNKCIKCRYHGLGCGGYTVKVGFSKQRQIPVFCNYSMTEKTCLKKTSDGIIDIRGNDFNNCKLFESKNPEDKSDETFYQFI